ncbi:MAG: hypothetical protein AAFV93_19290 [Chloroflexota bacterium]
MNRGMVRAYDGNQNQAYYRQRLTSLQHDHFHYSQELLNMLGANRDNIGVLKDSILDESV